MKRQIWMVCLIFSPSLFGLTKDDAQFMRKHKMLESKVLLHTDEWGVNPSKTEAFTVYKGQEKSLIDWKELDHNKWLDFNQWKLQRKIRDEDENWQIKLRDLRHKEVAGKVIQCLNDCAIFNEEGPASAQFGSFLREGDEFVTKSDSYAWIFLVDGSLIRVSPNTSFSLLEVNISQKKTFFAARLNQGHVYGQHRRVGAFEKKDRPETDLAFYPLLIKEANRENFMRREYQSFNSHQKMIYALEKNPGHIGQYDELNRLLAQNKKRFKSFDTEMFWVSANGSFLLENAVFHLFHETAGETLVKLDSGPAGFASSDHRQSAGEAFFRGYKNKRSQKLPVNIWHSMDPEGKTLVIRSQMEEKFGMVDHFVKRIPAILLARELFLRKHSGFLWEDFDEELLAKRHGYRLWGVKSGELDRRKLFLSEYTRRAETTNLRSIKKVFKNPNLEGFGRPYYAEALDRTLMALKKHRGYNMQVVKETNEAQYYLWIIKNADDFLPAYLR